MGFKKIYIELSDLCGLHCDFCPTQKAVRGILSCEKFEKLASQIADKSEMFTLHLLGDPLILKDLKEYLSIAKKYKMKLEITTSGLHLSPKNKALLLEFDHIHQINFSLIAFLAQKKLSLEDYFEPILEFCQEHLQRKLPSFINLRLWNWTEKLHIPKKNEVIYNFLRKKFSIEFDENKLKIRLARHIILHQALAFEWPSLSKPLISAYGSCHALSEQLGILSDGTLVPCCFDASGAVNLGNVFTESFEALLSSKRFLRLKKGFERGKRLEALCQRCKLYKVKTDILK